MYKHLLTLQATSTAVKIYSPIERFLVFGITLLLAACHHSHRNHHEAPAPTTYSIAGSISGLGTTGLILQNNAGDNLTIAANASSFQFATPVAAGGAYDVTVATQPDGLICSVSNGSGSGVSAAVTNVSVVCSSSAHAVSFSGDHLTFSSSSPQTIASGGAFSVTVTVDANYTRSDTFVGTCTGGTWAGNIYTTGTITGDCAVIFSAVPNPTVGGSVSGLSGAVTLRINGADDLPISSSGAFVFSTPLPEGTAYNVTVETQPVGQTCNVTNGSGTTGDSDVTNIAVVCSTNTYTVTPSGGTNGVVSPGSAVVANYDTNVALTATPDIGYVIYRWLLDGSVVQTGGTTYELENIDANHTVTVSFVVAPPRFAYVGSYAVDDLMKCDVDAGTNALSNCAVTGSGFFAPNGITINAAGTIAYVTNFNSSSVSQCDVDFSTGALSACTNTGATGLGGPQAITLNAANTSAYVANLGGYVTQYSVDAGTGALSGGTDTYAASFLSPQIVKFNAAETFAYVPDFDTGVTLCSVNPSTGSLSACASTGSGFSNTDGIEINSSGTIAYVSNSTGSISKCNIDAIDGTLNACIETAFPAFSGNERIILNQSGTILYVVNANNNTISQCAINLSTGDISGCVDSGATGLTTPGGIWLYY